MRRAAIDWKSRRRRMLDTFHCSCKNEGVLVRPADMIEKEMRKLFSIPDAKETRLWNRYMSNTFEPLNKPDSTIQDAGLYQGQVGTFLMFIFQHF